MQFNSYSFGIFLPIVFLLYWIIPKAMRWLVLLASGYVFYMFWNPKYILLLLLITIISYLGGLLVDKEQSETRRKVLVGFVVVLCFGILGVFKYADFIINSFIYLINLTPIEVPDFTWQVVMPVGISFYIFQAVGYVIDVYRKDTEPELHFGKYASFLAFFPLFGAGPIERSNNLLIQIKQMPKFKYEQATYGLKLMAWGYFKKIVVADTLAVYVDKIFSDLHFFSGGARLAAILFFTIQIYCDFSGYSDIARGTAKLFGIDIIVNFKSPYFATSIKEFWQRWHISLSTWFRDYLYIPLGGNRVSKKRNAMNLLITFLISGIWHGPSWTFASWGGLHGVLQIIEKKFKYSPKIGKIIIKTPKWIATFITFISVSILWAFFKAKSIKDAIYSVVFIFSGYENPIQYALDAYHNLGLNKPAFLRICIMLLILFLFDKRSLKEDVITKISSLRLVFRWLIYIIFIATIFVLAPSTSAEFIYFNF